MRIDSVAIKFEDKTLSEIQVFAYDEKVNRFFEFENRFQIPLKGSKNHANLSKYKLVDYRNIDSICHQSGVVRKRFIYLGDIIRVLPVLENYTFDYSPIDTVVGIGKNFNCISPTKLPRASLVSLAEIRIMNDLLAALANKPNGIFQGELRVRLSTNLINYRNFTFLHSFEILGKYANYSNDNKFLRLQTALKTNEVKKYASLMDVIERPALFIGARANLIKYEQRVSSTKFNLYLFGSAGNTNVRDTTVKKQGDSLTIKQLDNKIIKSCVIGAEMRMKFLVQKGFSAEIGSQLIAPFILTQSVSEDVGERIGPEEIQPDSVSTFTPTIPKKMSDRFILAPYFNFTIYPSKYPKFSSLHIRVQWFKSLLNRNNFIQLQFGSNINLAEILGKISK
jgi:hypothetical protein